MNIVTIYLVFVFFIVHCTQSLRCRSGNEKLSDEYQKIMQTCRRRFGGSKGDDDNSSTDDSNDSDNDSSSSDGSVFGHDFFSTSKNSNNNNDNEQNNNSRRMDEQSYKNYRSRQYKRNTDIRNYHSSSTNSSMQSRNMRNRDSQYGMQRENNSRNSNDGDQQSCRSHCFFNELNVIDRRGYPERISVTRVMTQGIKDPAIRDFIEQSLLECFHFLTSTMNLDKCSFSQHLLNCLTDKGKSECEDWND